jgi:hypothetical protein
MALKCFLRMGGTLQYAADMASHAACIVTPKSGIAFPQVWKNSGWKGGSANGRAPRCLTLDKSGLCVIRRLNSKP